MYDIFNPDVISAIMEFLGNEYIFVGLVNRQSRDSFRKNKNTTTNVSACYESVNRMVESGILEETGIRKEPYIYNTRSKEVIEYVEKNRIIRSVNGALAYSIRRQDLEMIDWMESRFEMHGPACMIAAVESGSLDMVYRFCIDGLLHYDADYFFPEGSHMYNLNERDRIEVCSNWRNYVGDYLVEVAKEKGYFEILQWLHSQKIPDPEECCGVVGDSVLTASDDMIQWMIANGYVMKKSDALERTKHGDFIEWIREIGMN